jgi:hypothetical protein
VISTRFHLTSPRIFPTNQRQRKPANRLTHFLLLWILSSGLFLRDSFFYSSLRSSGTWLGLLIHLWEGKGRGKDTDTPPQPALAPQPALSFSRLLAMIGSREICSFCFLFFFWVGVYSGTLLSSRELSLFLTCTFLLVFRWI